MECSGAAVWQRRPLYCCIHSCQRPGWRVYCCGPLRDAAKRSAHVYHLPPGSLPDQQQLLAREIAPCVLFRRSSLASSVWVMAWCPSGCVCLRVLAANGDGRAQTSHVGVTHPTASRCLMGVGQAAMEEGADVRSATWSICRRQPIGAGPLHQIGSAENSLAIEEGRRVEGYLTSSNCWSGRSGRFHSSVGRVQPGRFG